MRHEGLTQDITQQATQCDIQHALSQFAFCAIRYTLQYSRTASATRDVSDADRNNDKDAAHLSLRRRSV